VIYMATAGFRGKPRFIADKCIGCGACAQVCPTKAISVTDDEERRIELWLGRCILCARCQRSCAEEAIELTDVPMPSRKDKVLFESLALELIACEKCGRFFAPKLQLQKVANTISGKIGLSVEIKSRKYCESCKRQGVATLIGRVKY